MAYILIVNILLAFKLVWDWNARVKEHRVINHARSAIIDLAVYIVSALVLFLPDAYMIAGAIILALGYRWIAFDALFNIICKDKWDYYGDSSVLDRLMKKTGKYHLLVKAVPIIIGTVLCLI